MNTPPASCPYCKSDAQYQPETHSDGYRCGTRVGAFGGFVQSDECQRRHYFELLQTVAELREAIDKLTPDRNGTWLRFVTLDGLSVECRPPEWWREGQHTPYLTRPVPAVVASVYAHRKERVRGYRFERVERHQSADNKLLRTVWVYHEENSC